jgi:hypothetical protein
MRLRHHTGRTVHLSSGIIVHPARDLGGVIEQLDTYASDIRGRLGADTLGVSLWLPPALAATLAVESRVRARLRAELDARGLEVVTLSGVRYGESEPDWSSPARLEYTLDLARVLVDLLPDDAVRGSISTLGIGRRDEWTLDRDRSCGRILARLSGGLAEIAWQTGRAVRVGVPAGAGRRAGHRGAHRRGTGESRTRTARRVPRPRESRLHLGAPRRCAGHAGRQRHLGDPGPGGRRAGRGRSGRRGRNPPRIRRPGTQASGHHRRRGVRR